MHDRHGIEAMACQPLRVSLGQGRASRVVALGKLLLSALALGAGAIQAQEIEPRTDSNAPVGVNFLVAGYVYSEGGLSVDPSVPLTDANIEIHTTVFANARTLDLWGRSGKFEVVIPYAWLSGNADYVGPPSPEPISPADARRSMAGDKTTWKRRRGSV